MTTHERLQRARAEIAMYTTTRNLRGEYKPLSEFLSHYSDMLNRHEAQKDIWVVPPPTVLDRMRYNIETKGSIL